MYQPLGAAFVPHGIEHATGDDVPASLRPDCLAHAARSGTVTTGFDSTLLCPSIGHALDVPLNLFLHRPDRFALLIDPGNADGEILQKYFYFSLDDLRIIKYG